MRHYTARLCYNLLGECYACCWCQKIPHFVGGDGAVPSDLMFVGEGPGFNEDRELTVFVGRSGDLLDELLARAGLTRSNIYVTNLLKYHIYRNLDPKPEEVEADAHFLEDEIQEVKPRVVVTLGAFATRYFLGQSATMELVNGYLHECPERPFSIFPIYHPAAGLHDTTMLAQIVWDFERLISVAREEMPLHTTKPLGTELVPIDIVADQVAYTDNPEIAIDTEFDSVGDKGPWGLSISALPRYCCCCQDRRHCRAQGHHRDHQALQYSLHPQRPC